jgi:hypothetical protein
MSKMGLCINEEEIYSEIINCINKAHILNLDNHLDKVRHKL